ncbi:hypothetical protein ACFQ7N_10345 [Streptomyces niveus]|uniref:hypothetical protein n=1 Tax=Streptomyces niveus TaxID=193462 RepID=UPI003687592B
MNGEFPQRLPGGALGAMMREAQAPVSVDLSGIPAGEVADRCTGLARPHRRRLASSVLRGGEAA